MLFNHFIENTSITHFEGYNEDGIKAFCEQKLNISYDVEVKSGEVIKLSSRPHALMPYSDVNMETRRTSYKYSLQCRYPFFKKCINGYEYFTDLPLKYFPIGLQRDDVIFYSDEDIIKCRAYIFQTKDIYPSKWSPRVYEFNNGSHIVFGGYIGRCISDKDIKSYSETHYYQKITY